MVHTYRGGNIRIIFSKGKRGRVLPAEPEVEGKTRLTVRLDREIVDRFFEMAERSGGAPFVRN